MTPDDEVKLLRKELSGLFKYIKRVRLEIAAIHNPADDEHQFDSMSDQLDAIVEATEKATDSIMSAVEANDDILDKLRGVVTAKDVLALLDQMSTNGMQIMEACSFQDLTGQRVTKVARSLTYVEDRVNAVVEIWGKEAVEHEQVQSTKRTEDERLLHGPQREGTGISQDAIDKLFD